MGTRLALGKGLASLIPTNTISIENKDRIPGIAYCNLEELLPNDFQPRKQWHDSSLEELAQSIKENGIIQPLIVRKTDTGYQLIAGERRLRASKMAGLTQVPIVIRRSTDKEALELALIENVQREDLNCVDEAMAYYHLVEDFNLTQEEVAKRVGKERATVANYLRLLKLPSEVLEALRRQDITFGHAKAILSLDNRDDQLELLEYIRSNNLSVRATENVGSSAKKEKNGEAQPKTKNEVFDYVRELLERKLQTKVKLAGKESGGKITIEFYSKEDLDRIVTLVKNAST